MFICGYHFPKEMGNNVEFSKVVEKIDADTKVDGVKEIKLYMGLRTDEKLISYTNMNTFMAKALVNYYNNTEGEGQKYFIYTNRYQIAEISKTIDKDDETLALCKNFDSMEQFRIELA